MSEHKFTQMSDLSDIARIRSKSSDGCRLYLEFRNGKTATVDSSEYLNFEVGSVVFVRDADNYIEKAPDDLWPTDSWVGIIRLKLDDITIVDSGGRWKIVDTNCDIAYEEGNTVELKDSCGIIRVLSDKPIKYIDYPVLDSSVTDKFKLNKNNKETFSDFGGLQHVVDRARELIDISFMNKDTLNQIGSRSIKGVLFTGLPGTGKTMLARIIANNTDSTFYEISGPEVLSKWYGQSEEIIRKLFEDAGKQERAIIFFDEIDSIAGHRSDESHEASKRVVAQLLTLMDGFTIEDNIVIIAATNRPQDIDTALLRPGRFDWEINFPLPSLIDRELILETSARNLSALSPLPHKWVAKETESWSAAELTAIWSEAALLAAADNRTTIIVEDYIGGFERVSEQRRKTIS